MRGEAGRSAISIPAIPGDTGSLGEQVLDRKFVSKAECKRKKYSIDNNVSRVLLDCLDLQVNQVVQA